MLQFLSNLLRLLIVDSGLFYKLCIPIIHRVFIKLPVVRPNHQIVDQGGSTIQVTKYNGKLFPPVGTSKLAGIKNIRIRDSDVLVAGYPKTGCHWLYEIVYMLTNKTQTISKYGKEIGGMIDLIPDIILDSNPLPRVLNTHLLYNELPYGIQAKKTKIILTLRGAKDTAVSYYNHNLSLSKVYGYDGKFENHFKLFISAGLEYGCFFEYYHDWCRVITSNPMNEIYVMDFAELKKDPVGMILKLAKFLGAVITPQQASVIAEASSFQKMKEARSNDPMTASLFRKGVVGDWKNWMTDEQKEEVDRRWKKVEDEYKPILDRQYSA